MTKCRIIRSILLLSICTSTIICFLSDNLICSKIPTFHCLFFTLEFACVLRHRCRGVFVLQDYLINQGDQVLIPLSLNCLKFTKLNKMVMLIICPQSLSVSRTNYLPHNCVVVSLFCPICLLYTFYPNPTQHVSVIMINE